MAAQAPTPNLDSLTRLNSVSKWSPAIIEIPHVENLVTAMSCRNIPISDGHHQGPEASSMPPGELLRHQLAFLTCRCWLSSCWFLALCRDREIRMSGLVPASREAPSLQRAGRHKGTAACSRVGGENTKEPGSQLQKLREGCAVSPPSPGRPPQQGHRDPQDLGHAPGAEDIQVWLKG